MNAVEHAPQDRPVLAFAHANGIPGHSYDTFLAPFQERFDVRVVECLGQDPRYPVDRDWVSLSLELEAFLEPLPKPIIGLGHSMGSVLMFWVAHRHPDWFQALIMLDPPVANGPHALALRLTKLTGLGDRFSPARKSKGRLDYWANWDDVQSYFNSRGLFKAFDPRALEDYLRAGLERHGDGWRLRFRPDVEVAVFQQTPTGVTRLPRLKVPGVLITGEGSPELFQNGGRRHARRHRMKRLFAPGSHMYPLERPDSTASLVLGELDQLLAGEGAHASGH
ncbi:alpha/beta fold hydrolase [Alloalcanivorax mobilis]|uniref:alpha/beta fold hydrolase n=1 Tax=Alloalcanivorax mobilis TaxID=2019569 RepID=UPI000B5B227E|nr:alpha/beta hydrolase [Alloalcanivorax mobilis]ASK34022.1 alpha/beta hydrolase [Alcanivorax sp. N3-2A]|tara:strand:+ start:22931 stop:23767 length:837 start_codon:yes stop_codon:yes gene_type:complete